jgi:ribulose-5-phosphate 4-epimerase/fuculose-1-phosphate aldolase
MDRGTLLNEAIEACRSLHARGLLAAGDGNVSVRLDQETLAITPRGVPKARLQPHDFALLSLDGTVLSGNPSSARHRMRSTSARSADAECEVSASLIRYCSV